MARKPKTKKSPKGSVGDEHVTELDGITASEWNTIKLLADQVHRSGRSRGCRFRAAVEAFLEWTLTNNTRILIAAEELDPSLH